MCDITSQKRHYDRCGITLLTREKTPLQKDQSIVRLLDGLTARLGPRAFDVVDHWESDLCAIGIARPDNHDVLVYISTNGESDERCSVSLELPPQPGSDIPYTAAGDHDAASVD